MREGEAEEMITHPSSKVEGIVVVVDPSSTAAATEDLDWRISMGGSAKKRKREEEEELVVAAADAPQAEVGGSKSVDLFNLHPQQQQQNIIHVNTTTVNPKNIHVNVITSSSYSSADLPASPKKIMENLEEEERKRNIKILVLRNSFKALLNTLPSIRLLSYTQEQAQDILDDARDLGFWRWIQKYAQGNDAFEGVGLLTLLSVLDSFYKENLASRRRHKNLNLVNNTEVAFATTTTTNSSSSTSSTFKLFLQEEEEEESHDENYMEMLLDLLMKKNNEIYHRRQQQELSPSSPSSPSTAINATTSTILPLYTTSSTTTHSDLINNITNTTSISSHHEPMSPRKHPSSPPLSLPPPNYPTSILLSKEKVEEMITGEILLPLVREKFEKSVTRRQRIESLGSFGDAVDLIRNSKKILVLTGAGVSVSCGIPDFRSKNGIYSRLSEFQLSDPQEMFDLDYFKFKPETFYAFAKEIYPSNFKPSPSHLFIKLLEEKGKLLRNYTQNIDTIENIAGITKLIQCHGSFATATCITCGYHVPGSEIEEDIFSQRVPLCPRCKETREAKKLLKRKKSGPQREGDDDDEEDEDEGLGIMKPDIVFFGENLPQDFHNQFAQDRKECDLLIVMGSSLKVAPVGNVKDRIPPHVPQILINMESLSHMASFDIHLLGYSDTVTTALSHALGWTSDGSSNVRSLLGKTLPGQSSLDSHGLATSTLPPPSLPTLNPSTVGPANNLSCVQGRLPWHWLFEGGIGHEAQESDEEVDLDEEDDSSEMGDSNTEEEADEVPFHSEANLEKE